MTKSKEETFDIDCHSAHKGSESLPKNTIKYLYAWYEDAKTIGLRCALANKG